MRRQGAQRKPLIGRADLAQLREPAQAEHARRAHQVLLHQDDERGAAGHHERVVGIIREQGERLVERLRLDVVERPHPASRAFTIAREIP